MLILVSAGSMKSTCSSALGFTLSKTPSRFSPFDGPSCKQITVMIAGIRAMDERGTH